MIKYRAVDDTNTIFKDAKKSEKLKKTKKYKSKIIVNVTDLFVVIRISFMDKRK